MVEGEEREREREREGLIATNNGLYWLPG